MALFGKRPDAPDGVPGVRQTPGMTPQLTGLLMAQPKGQARIGKKEVERAAELLTDYKKGKTNLEKRIVEDELWWELRHWEVIRKSRAPGSSSPEPTSAWLFNAILNKHADAMDNYPEPVVLPRERSDQESAQTLSSVLPVILEYNDYEQTYSDNWWEKLKHGTAAYGVFWNSEKENGLGDVDVREIDLLKIFWEPGVTDIQKSRNLFIVELVDEDVLEQQYPQHRGKLGGKVIDAKQYIYDDTVDVSKKSLVVDWYYKVRTPSGRTLLHYAKFVGDTLLFASENEESYQEAGWYADGRYPVVLDVLFPEKGTPAGFGYVAITKDPQIYIDKLSANILESSMMATKKRFFVADQTDINETELLDWSKPLVHVATGSVTDERIKEIVCKPLDAVYMNVVQMKIEELKDTAANRDVNSGSSGSGVTAAAAIAALQEAGNKTSRDMIAASYRAHTAVNTMVIERIRQFYDETRSFRVTGQAPGAYDFVDMSNAGLKDQPLPLPYPGMSPEETMFRRPVFDIKIKAQKKNPFSRMEQNERAKELYGMGFFDPARAQQALVALEMMDFEGIDKVREQVNLGQTLFNQLQQAIGLLQALTGQTASPAGEGADRAGQAEKSGGGDTLSGAVLAAQTPMTDYGERLAQRSKPDMEMGAAT